MANGGGFAGGFATGFSSAYGAASQNRRLRDQLGFQQQELDFRKGQAKTQQEQFGQTIELDRNRLDLQKTQEDRLRQHQEFQQKLQTQEMNLNLKRQDQAEMEQFYKLLDVGIHGDPKTFSALTKLYQINHGIDPSDPKAKAIADVITSLQPKDLEEIKTFIGDMYGKGLQPGTVSVLAKQFISDDKAFFDITKSFMAQRTAETQARTPMLGRETLEAPNTYFEQKDLPGKFGPESTRAVLTPAEKALEGSQAAAQKYATDTLTDAENALGLRSNVQAMRSAIESGKFTPGTAGGARLAFGKFLQFIGVKPEDVEKTFPGLDLNRAIGDPVVGESIQRNSAQLGLLIASGMSRLTNMGLAYVQEALPGLMSTPDGALIALDLYDRIATRGEQMRDKYIELQEKGDFRDLIKYKAYLDRVDPIVKPGDELDKRIRGQLESRVSGAGVRLPAIQTQPRRFVDLPDARLPIIEPRDKGGRATVDTDQGVVPYIEDEADLIKFLKDQKPGTLFIYGPEKVMGRIPEAK